jgi:GT2 family glycosyltransferase
MDFNIFVSMQSFSIIIVSWNALHHLQTYLPSVCATKHLRYEVILADNASTDGSADWVRKHYPNVRIVSMEQNYGYCGGNNRAAKHAKHLNIIFLNNDVEVTPNWLDPIERMLDSNSSIAVVQPKIRSWQKKSYFEYAGAAGGFIDKNGYPFCRGRIFDTTEEDLGQYDESTSIFWSSGAAIVVKKSLFEQMDGFYEPFKFHMEEIDLCWRIQLAGKQIWYCPESVVYHLGGGSLNTDNPQKTYFNFRNNLIMLARNLPTRFLILNMFIRMNLDALAGLSFLAKGEFRNFWAILRAHLAFYAHIPNIKNYRNESHLPIRKPIVILSGGFGKSIIYSYYLNRRRTFDSLFK